MGVSGCGKTTAATWLAEQFDLEFIEADDYHSDENIARMEAGIPLTVDGAAPLPGVIETCRNLVHKFLFRIHN